MEPPTIAHVYSAIDILYHSTKVDGQAEASKWLEEFQRSVKLNSSLSFSPLICSLLQR